MGATSCPSTPGRSRRLVVGMALVVGLAVVGFPASAATPDDPPTSSEAAVEARLWNDLADGRTATFWVYLREQADVGSAAGIADRVEQGRQVYEELTETAEVSQAGLVRMLAAERVSYESFWIANTVKVTGDAALVERIATRPEVDQITADRVYQIPEPAPADEEPGTAAVEWNIDRVNAPQVWNTFAVTGEDIVVGSIDTGVQFDHPALVNQYRGNNGDGTFDHDYNWWDPSNVCGNPSRAPCDNDSHGTHTMGTMVGDDGSNQIGVAPGARWITAKGCETRSCSQSALLSAGQFILAPTDLAGNNPRPELRPHIVNNSWGGGANTDPWYQPTVQAWVAAGIFPQFASGNPGPACGLASNPGNLSESYAAGAFDIDGNVYVNSGRGPSAWGDDIVKPNIAAPGVAVRSSVAGDGYAAFTGTSMASPHVAATVALMWSAAPSLVRDIDGTREVLDQTAIDTENLTCGGSPGNNNVWGQGKLNAFAAVEQSPRGPTGRLEGTVLDAATEQPIADATITISGPIERTRTTGTDGGYAITLPIGDYTVTASAFAYEPRNAAVSIVEGETVIRPFPLEVPDRPGLNVAPASLDFGDVAVGTVDGPLTVTLTSTGAAPLTVSQVSEPDGGFAPAGGTCGTPPFRLSRLDSCTLEYSFSPTLQKPAETAVTLISSADDNPQRVLLRGTGVSTLGAELWVSRYDGTGVDSDVAHDLAFSPDGATTYITGRNGGDGTLTDYVTVAYDTASGRELWVARYDGPASKTDEAWALSVSPDGSRVFVTGNSATGSFSRDADYATVAYDAATGNQLWVARYNGPGNNQDGAGALAVSPDGGMVLVTGGSQSGSLISSTDYATIAYDAATGDEQWVARYNGPGNNQDYAQALVLDPGGDTAFVTGASRTGGFLTDDYGTVAYDTATGEQLWEARYDGPGNAVDRAEALGVSPDGSHVFVTGGSSGAGTSSDYATIAYDATTGGETWVARYDAPTSGSDAASAMALTPDGTGLYVTGGSSGDYATAAYDTDTGDEVWVARYDGPTRGIDSAAAVDVSPDGSNVFVTGNSVGLSFDVATIAYHADSGAEHWVARYNGPVDDGDAGTTIGVSPDGSRVLVTGQSVGDGTGADYATIAYGAASEITLGAEGRLDRGRHTVDLVWGGATTAEVDVHRDGEVIATVVNDGFHSDPVGAEGTGSYAYLVCEAGTVNCSNEVIVRFGVPPGG